MKYLLDTNVCIRFLSGRSVALFNKLNSTPKSFIVICSVVKAELFFGSMNSQNPEQNLAKQLRFLNQFESLPFDDRAAHVFGTIRADLTRQGKVIGPYDLQIAAIALTHDVTLVTHNIAEFGRVANLRIEDWEQDS